MLEFDDEVFPPTFRPKSALESRLSSVPRIECSNVKAFGLLCVDAKDRCSESEVGMDFTLFGVCKFEEHCRYPYAIIGTVSQFCTEQHI